LFPSIRNIAKLNSDHPQVGDPPGPLVDETTGEALLTQDKISDHAVSFYQNLYSTASHSHRDSDTYLGDCNLKKIPGMLANKLDQPITLEEMDEVVKSLKKSKSPGWDGLTAEFINTSGMI